MLGINVLVISKDKRKPDILIDLLFISIIKQNRKDIKPNFQELGDIQYESPASFCTCIAERVSA